MNLLTDSVGGVIKTSDRECASNEEDDDRRDPKLGQRTHSSLGGRGLHEGRAGLLCRHLYRHDGRRRCSLRRRLRLSRRGWVARVCSAFHAESAFADWRTAVDAKVSHNETSPLISFSGLRITLRPKAASASMVRRPYLSAAKVATIRLT
jgi:hypothetical protein